MKGLERLSVIRKLNRNNINWENKDIFRILRNKHVKKLEIWDKQGNKSKLIALFPYHTS